MYSEITTSPGGQWVNSSLLDTMDAISQMLFADTFSWMKTFMFLIRISQKFVPKGPIDNKPALA